MRLVGTLVLVLLLEACNMPIAPPSAQAIMPLPTSDRRIVGFVFADANGNGQFDADETSLVGATVTARSDSDELVQISDANGWFGFLGVYAGEWVMSAMMPAYRCADHTITVTGKTPINLSCAPVENATPVATQLSGTLAIQICPDPAPDCVQVWLQEGASATWWAVCPTDRWHASRFCMAPLGWWSSVE